MEYGNKITAQVKRKKKAGAGLLKGVMIVFGVLFILMGIMFSRGFMLSGFLLVVLYFIYDTFSRKESVKKNYSSGERHDGPKDPSGNRPVSARQHQAYGDEASRRNCRHRYA